MVAVIRCGWLLSFLVFLEASERLLMCPGGLWVLLFACLRVPAKRADTETNGYGP